MKKSSNVVINNPMAINSSNVSVISFFYNFDSRRRRRNV